MYYEWRVRDRSGASPKRRVDCDLYASGNNPRIFFRGHPVARFNTDRFQFNGELVFAAGALFHARCIAEAFGDAG